jgi:2-polyprenyl-3-methyl-5-hydroxy-6-metoxy-1,4-benzoquinol methylase
MKKLENCPLCGSNEFIPFLTCLDHTVSNEEFKIVRCKSCGFRFTNPRPHESRIGSYYQSEDYISHSNTKKGFINSLYQLVRQKTLKDKLNLVKQISNDQGLIDIGSGTGNFLKYCVDHGYKAIGIEPSTNARNFSKEKLKLSVYDESKLDELEPSHYGIITMWHVLEHVYHLRNRVEQIKNLLKPEGKLIVAVPNCESFDAHHYQQYWAAYDVPRHLYHFRLKDLKLLFTENGFVLEEVKPMKFDSFYVSMLSEKYQNSKLGPVKAFLIGLISNIRAKAGKNPGYSSQIYIFKKLKVG